MAGGDIRGSGSARCGTKPHAVQHWATTNDAETQALPFPPLPPGDDAVGLPEQP
jgi:hypothetical protein